MQVFISIKLFSSLMIDRIILCTDKGQSNSQTLSNEPSTSPHSLLPGCSQAKSSQSTSSSLPRNSSHDTILARLAVCPNAVTNHGLSGRFSAAIPPSTRIQKSSVPAAGEEVHIHVLEALQDDVGEDGDDGSFRIAWTRLASLKRGELPAGRGKITPMLYIRAARRVAS